MQAFLIASTAAALALVARHARRWRRAPKQGGAAVVTFNNDLTTLDPQVGYDWQNWSVIKSIFDGLMDYKPGTTELEPDLAESYTVSDDGLTYTFKLRPGVKFHNGRADDPGGRQMLARARRQSRDAEPGRRLSSAPSKAMTNGRRQGDRAFRHPHRRRQDRGHHPVPGPMPPSSISWPSTSPMSCPRKKSRRRAPTGARSRSAPAPSSSSNGCRASASCSSATRIISRQGVPYLDKLTFEFGQDPTVAVLRLKNGEVDIVGDGIPPAQFAEIDGRSRQQGSDRQRAISSIPAM